VIGISLIVMAACAVLPVLLTNTAKAIRLYRSHQLIGKTSFQFVPSMSVFGFTPFADACEANGAYVFLMTNDPDNRHSRPPLLRGRLFVTAACRES
jgi:hypothetical protein